MTCMEEEKYCYDNVTTQKIQGNKREYIQWGMIVGMDENNIPTGFNRVPKELINKVINGDITSYIKYTDIKYNLDFKDYTCLVQYAEETTI